MLKWIGAGMIVISGIGIGRSACDALRRREGYLREILKLLSYLKEEIRYGNTPLKTAFGRIGRKLGEPFGSCMLHVSEELESGKSSSFSVAFRACTEWKMKTLPLSEEEKEAFLSIGESLGYLDTSVQIKELERSEKIFEEFLERVKEEVPGRLRLYKGLGILGGFLIVVILW